MVRNRLAGRVVLAILAVLGVRQGLRQLHRKRRTGQQEQANRTTEGSSYSYLHSPLSSQLVVYVHFRFASGAMVTSKNNDGFAITGLGEALLTALALCIGQQGNYILQAQSSIIPNWHTGSRLSEAHFMDELRRVIDCDGADKLGIAITPEVGHTAVIPVAFLVPPCIHTAAGVGDLRGPERMRLTRTLHPPRGSQDLPEWVVQPIID